MMTKPSPNPMLVNVYPMSREFSLGDGKAVKRNIGVGMKPSVNGNGLGSKK